MVLSRFRTQPLPPPAWDRRDDRESLAFTAIRARLWVFGAAISAITLGAGALVSALAILLAPDSAGGARILIIAAALCLSLPLIILVKAPFRARTLPATLSYDSDGIDLIVGSEPRRIALRDLDSLIWCTGTEYSRIVLAGPTTRCSLLVGIARPIRGHRSDLPELPSGLRLALEHAGLFPTASTPNYTRYLRRETDRTTPRLT